MHIKKLLAAVSCLAFACAGTFLLSPDLVVRAEDGQDLTTDVSIPITEDYFKDPVFRQIVLERFDLDGDKILTDTEIQVRTTIDVSESGIADLTGIGFFTDLVSLKCNGNQLTSLDLTSNTKLDTLNCNTNSLTSLAISNAAPITNLDCGNNQLTSLDLKSFSKLMILACHSNRLTSLDVSSNTKLQVLNCAHNSISSLNVSQNTSLLALTCQDNNLLEIDVSHNQGMRYLLCYGNGIKELDLTACPPLADLMYAERLLKFDGKYSYYEHTSDTGVLSYSMDCTVNPVYVPPISEDGIAISSANFPDAAFCAYVATTACDMNQNGWLSPDEIAAIKTIDINDKGIGSIKGVEFFTELEVLSCNFNSITEADLSQNLKLTVFSAEGCQIKELDLRANTALVVVNVCMNNMNTFMLGECPNMTMLACFGNKFNTMDITKCPNLVQLANLYPRVKETHSGVEYYAHMNEDETLVLCYDLYTSIGIVLPGDPSNPDPNDPTPDPNKPDPSTEPLFAQFIERLYNVALERDSDPSGKAFWLDKVLNEGFSGGRCAIGFLIEAPEFLNRGLSDDQFVDVLYKTFFDRAADADGKAFWMGHLASDMTREEVVRGFINSTEWCNLCAYYGVKSGAPSAKAEKPSDNAVRFATRLYTECIGRQPEEDGLKFWALRLTNLETTGAQAAYDFFHSPEFMNLSLNDIEYITRLYRTFMGREPDSSGLQFWQNHLVSDMTRDEVLKGFAESQEFTNICNEYGIERGTI